LQPAIDKKVDLVIHGGDLLYRSKVPDALIAQAFEPLLKIADRGIPVFIVPGNHERSQIRQSLFELHKNIFIFDRPRTFSLQIKDLQIALSGFPYFRNGIRAQFKNILAKTEWEKHKADIRLLCMHHIVEGAQVGPNNYTFRYNEGVIKGQDLPGKFAAVLSGHIHRFQVLENDLQKQPLPVPVYYPGSVERTSFAEKNEEKGFLILQVEKSAQPGGRISNYEFVKLPARPMADLNIEMNQKDFHSIEQQIKNFIETTDPNAVIRIKFSGNDRPEIYNKFTVEYLRSIVPPTMNISLKFQKS